MTDPVEDLKELHRIKKMGFRGIFVSNDPLPERRYDNPMREELWTVVEAYDLPVNIHIGGNMVRDYNLQDILN